MDIRANAPIPPSAASSRRRGLAWRTIRYGLAAPFAAFGAEDVIGNARVIPELTVWIRTCPGPDGRARVAIDRRLDIEAMALAAGVSIAEILRLLANRRRQTARAVFFYLSGGFGFLGLWLFEAVQTPAYARLTYLAGLLGICAACFLSAYYNALVNWQVRTLRLGTVREFLWAKEHGAPGAASKSGRSGTRMAKLPLSPAFNQMSPASGNPHESCSASFGINRQHRPEDLWRGRMAG